MQGTHLVTKSAVLDFPLTGSQMSLCLRTTMTCSMRALLGINEMNVRLLLMFRNNHTVGAT